MVNAVGRRRYGHGRDALRPRVHTSTRRVRNATESRRTRSVVAAAPAPTASTLGGGYAWGRTTDELIRSAVAQLDSAARETSAVIGLTNDLVDAVQVMNLSDGEPPALVAIQALLTSSETVAMVVFTDHEPPQWVRQPCYLLRDVVVVGNIMLRTEQRAQQATEARGRAEDQ